MRKFLCALDKASRDSSNRDSRELTTFVVTQGLCRRYSTWGIVVVQKNLGLAQQNYKRSNVST